VLYNAWQEKEIVEGMRLKIKVTKKQNKTFFDEILVLDEEAEKEEKEEETEEETEEEKSETKKIKPKLKG